MKMQTCTECTIHSDFIMHPNSKKEKKKEMTNDLKSFKYVYHEIKQCLYLPLIAQCYCYTVLLSTPDSTKLLLCCVAIYP